MYVPLFADIITAERWLMIMPMAVLSNFLIYCVINAFTPGPGNILWLAIHIVFSKPSTENAEQSASFLKGFMLQFVNVKIYMFGVTALTGYVVGYMSSFPVLLFFELVIATIGTIATCTWIGLGVLIQKFYLRHFRVINIILALTLLECIWGMLR